MALITSEATNELFTAISKAQSLMNNAKKASDNPFFKSKYADLSDVWDVAQGPLTANGLCVIQGAESEGDSVIVSCRVCHSSGQWVESSLKLVPTKRDPQGIGSAITYGRRYLLASMTGVVTDDDDGNAASGNKEGGAKKSNGTNPSTHASGQACTEKQAEFIRKVYKSHVVTKVERDRIEAKIADGSADGSAIIKWLETETASRKEVERQQAEDAAKENLKSDGVI